MKNDKPTVFLNRDGSVRMESMAYPDDHPQPYLRVAVYKEIWVGDPMKTDDVTVAYVQYRLVRDTTLMYVYEQL